MALLVINWCNFIFFAKDNYDMSIDLWASAFSTVVYSFSCCDCTLASVLRTWREMVFISYICSLAGPIYCLEHASSRYWGTALRPLFPICHVYSIWVFWLLDSSFGSYLFRMGYFAAFGLLALYGPPLGLWPSVTLLTACVHWPSLVWLTSLTLHCLLVTIDPNILMGRLATFRPLDCWAAPRPPSLLWILALVLL